MESDRDIGHAHLKVAMDKLLGKKGRKVQRLMIRLAMLMNRKGLGGCVKNLNNGRTPHLVTNIGTERFSAVYFASRCEWQVFNGYGTDTTTTWHFKQYSHVSRFFESGCTNEFEATHVRTMK